MKFLVCILGIFVTVSCKMMDEAKVKECATTHKITDMSIVQKMMIPGFSTTNKDEKCFGLCTAVATDSLSPDGKLMPGLEAFAPDTLDKAKIPAVYLECSKITDADPCEQGYKQWTCLLDKSKKI